MFLFGGGDGGGMHVEWKQCEVLPLAGDQRMAHTAAATFFQTREKEITENNLL